MEGDIIFLHVSRVNLSVSVNFSTYNSTFLQLAIEPVAGDVDKEFLFLLLNRSM